MKNLTFKDCEAAMYKWAWSFKNKRFEFWELINAAWLESGVRNLPKSKIKFASGRIRYGMIDYMRKETKYRMWHKAKAEGKPFPKMHNFSDIQVKLGDDRSLLDLLKNSHADVADIEGKDFVNYIINNSGLTRDEKLVIKMYFIAGLLQKDIAKAIGITESRVSQMIIRALGMIRSGKAISNYEMEE